MLKVSAKRHRDLGRARNQVACRLHAVLCELIPGGVAKQITAAHAAALLQRAEPAGAVALARHQLAAEFLADLRDFLWRLWFVRRAMSSSLTIGLPAVIYQLSVHPARRRARRRIPTFWAEWLAVFWLCPGWAADEFRDCSRSVW